MSAMDEDEELRADAYGSRRSCSKAEELGRMMPLSPGAKNVNKRLSKQLSMCETRRDIAWERRRTQILKQGQRRQLLNELEELHLLTDEDLHELKGCIELGFGFNEEAGQRLCRTIPALDMYLSVHRRAIASHASTLRTRVSSSTLSDLMDDQSSGGSPKSSSSSDQWNICSPGDDPQLVKTKLKHWAQAVGCSVRQSY
uniref:Uncharacterized protein n=1 Tax=Kalanchoe fedtschenkoi TaxID=63787 RepID=A0A7N0RCZ2_KALFE